MARIAGPYGHAILAGAILAVGCRLARWLEWTGGWEPRSFAGYTIWYWPDIVVEHLGGESSKTVKSLSVSKSGQQLTLWRMRSELIFYRKHHGASAWIVKQQEMMWHRLRAWRNAGRAHPGARAKRDDSLQTVALMRQAWSDTEGGRVSPERPW